MPRGNPKSLGSSEIVSLTDIRRFYAVSVAIEDYYTRVLIPELTEIETHETLSWVVGAVEKKMTPSTQ